MFSKETKGWVFEIKSVINSKIEEESTKIRYGMGQETDSPVPFFTGNPTKNYWFIHNKGNNDDNHKYKIYGYKNENRETGKYNKDGFNIIITKFKVYLTNDKVFLNNYAVSVKSSNNDVISDKYLGYYLSHKYKNINLKSLKNFNIHIPPIDVQEEIVNYMNENNEKMEKLKTEIEDLNYKSSLWFINVD
jgi:restriction endonuclease S subunit